MLADLYCKETGGGWDANNFILNNNNVVISNDIPLKNWADLSSSEIHTAIELNDGYQYNFIQIANYIEENF